jgi:glycosyltransferase involved in cell wall biosynthesis
LAGVPAVATGVGAVGEVVVPGETGAIVPPLVDGPGLAAAVEDALGREWDPDVIRRAGRRFLWAAVAPDWEALLARVASPPA